MVVLLLRCLIFTVLVCHSYEILVDKLLIHCDSHDWNWKTMPELNYTGNKLTDSMCSLPKHTYPETLREYGLESSNLRELYINNLPPNLPLRKEQFAGLKLTSLRIATLHYIFTHSSNRQPDAALDLTIGEDIEIRCMNKVLQLSQLTPILANMTISVKKITIKNCEVPPETYAKALWNLNISLTGVTELNLRLPVHKKVPASSLQNLTLQTLSMIWPDPYQPLMDINRQVVDVDIFKVVPTIENFLLYGAILPTLPASKLKEVSLNKGASVGKWGDCKGLKRLSLSEWEVPEISEWVTQCSQLTSLELEQLNVTSLRRVLPGVNTLKELKIKSCQLSALTETLLVDTLLLVKLDLSNNSLMQVHRNTLSRLIWLEELSLPDNKLLDAKELIEELRPLKRLRKLNLDRNMFLNFCMGQEPLYWMLIQEISLRETALSDLCFGNWSSLRTIDASKTRVQSIQLDEKMLPRPKDHDLLVDLQSCTIVKYPKRWFMNDLMIQTYEQAKNITILVFLTSDCDCANGYFARALRSLPNLQIKGAVCSDGEPLQSSRLEHIQRLECDKSLYRGCIRRRSWKDNSKEMDCAGLGLSTVPDLRNIARLFSLRAADNHIVTLPDSYPDTLLKVDVSNNDISRLSAEATTALFSKRERSVALAQNPLICDCENKQLIAALHKHREQVVDFENVTCAGDEIKVSDVDLDTLCAKERERQVLAGAAAGGALLVGVLVAAMLCYRYWKQIKVFLFARGFCLCCVKEHELDEQRPYDAFISFAHGDEQLVAEELLPVLDREYLLCVHTRDWMPGELITTQVFRSVERSRRTVIVLSRNFVSSVWGMLEFRTAYTSALSEGRVRVIVVLLDDVIDDEALDGDLRWYLRTNTYLKWGDPWFWEKLRYAMPHRSSPPPENSQPPMPYDHVRLPQIDMEKHRDDLENQQPVLNDPIAIENVPDSL